MADTRHGIGNGDTGEAGAAGESIIADTRHRIGNGDAGEASATRESIGGNGLDAITDG